jgi:hypothetical protein
MDEDDEPQALNALGEVVSMPRVLLDTVTLGGVQLEGVVAGVVPLEIQSKVDSRAVDGLLGYSVFSDLFFAMDFPNQSLVLSNDWPKNLAPIRTELAIVEHDDVPFVHAELQGKSFEVMVDTGANDRLHLRPFEVAGLSWKAEPRPGFLLAAVGDLGREQVGRLSGTLELGQLRQDDPVVGISDGPDSIGTGLLRSFCLVFHEAEDKLWMCSIEDGPMPSPPERSVGLSMIADTTGWRIVGIIPNSPAETAAMMPGELVTQIEGQPAHNWTRDQIQNWIDTHGTLALRLSAKSGERDISLPVWSLVP